MDRHLEGGRPLGIAPPDVRGGREVAVVAAVGALGPSKLVGTWGRCAATLCGCMSLPRSSTCG